jgi:hypothetical protein
MQPDKKKDALTDLVGVAGSPANTQLDKPLKDGEAITPSGEIVTLGVDQDRDREISNLARKIAKWMRAKRSSK